MSENLRLCILGCGAIARTHATALNTMKDRVDLFFASRSRSKSEEYSRKYRGIGFFEDYDQAFSSPDIDAVLICTPHHLHFSLACAALNQGKHVIVEKPMALSTSEAIEMNDLAEKMDRRLLVAENHRFRPSVNAIRAMLDAGDLGTLKWIRINVMSRNVLAASDWRADASTMGGGPLIDGGIHWVNVMLTYGGDAESVFAQTAPTTEPNFPREDTITLLCKHQSGAVGTLTYSWGISGTPKQKMYALYGSKGSLYVTNNGWIGIMRGQRRFVKLFPIRDWRGFSTMWTDFLDCILKDKVSLMNSLTGIRDVAFIEKAYASVETGQVQTLPSFK